MFRLSATRHRCPRERGHGMSAPAFQRSEIKSCHLAPALGVSWLPEVRNRRLDVYGLLSGPLPDLRALPIERRGSTPQRPFPSIDSNARPCPHSRPPARQGDWLGRPIAVSSAGPGSGECGAPLRIEWSRPASGQALSILSFYDKRRSSMVGQHRSGGTLCAAQAAWPKTQRRGAFACNVVRRCLSPARRAALRMSPPRDSAAAVANRSGRRPLKSW
jgi:hypothetical protein